MNKLYYRENGKRCVELKSKESMLNTYTFMRDKLQVIAKRYKDDGLIKEAEYVSEHHKSYVLIVKVGNIPFKRQIDYYFRD